MGDLYLVENNYIPDEKNRAISVDLAFILGDKEFIISKTFRTDDTTGPIFGSNPLRAEEPNQWVSLMIQFVDFLIDNSRAGNLDKVTIKRTDTTACVVTRRTEETLKSFHKKAKNRVETNKKLDEAHKRKNQGLQ